MVSIIIPAYNAEKHITETINSVLSQTYNDWELLIVDDGSSDNTENIIKNFCNEDRRIKYFHQKNSGVSSTRNNGLSKAIGEYVAFLDSDDLWLPTFLDKKVTTLSNNPEVGAVNSNVRFIDGNSNDIDGTSRGPINKDIEGLLGLKSRGVTTGPSGIVCRKECVENIGGFNVKLSNTADKMFYLDLSKETIIGNINELLWIYRFHEESMHMNILNMINDYENYIEQIELKSYFNSKHEKKTFKKYIYKICFKESIKQGRLKYGFLFLFKYIFS